MKKIVPLVALLAAVSIGVSASPQTTFEKGQWEVNAGMWDAKARSSGFKSGGEWDFNGGVTYGLSDRTAVQFQYYNLDTDNTGGESMEFNYIYSLRPDVAAYAGYNRVSMTGLPSTLFGKTKRENSIFQIGLIGRKHLNEDLDLYGKVALGTDSTTIWEAGLNYEIDDNLDVNAGYRYMNTEAGPDRNMSYSGWLAGVSYRFGGGSSYDYGRYDREETTVVTTTTAPTYEEPAPVENDYYFNSIHFASDSDTPAADQKANLDEFVARAKETGHTFKLVGRTDSDGDAAYNDDLSIRRVRKVAEYATDRGVSVDKLVGMYKGEAEPTETNATEEGKANNRRVDIYEHR